MKIYAIKDIKANAFNKPYIDRDNQVAVREFARTCNAQPGFDKELLVKDSELYVLGEFDETTGKITPLETPVMLARGVDVLIETTKISLEDVNAEYEKIKAILETLSGKVADRINTIDSQVVSKVAGMANNLAQQHKIKKVLAGK